MSCNYADGLSPYHDKGLLGLDEKFDSKSVVNAKVALLAKWINDAKHVVIHTGAGISTSAGIPDFRGPKGVWTLQAKGQKPDISTDFNEATPTVTHMAITKLVDREKVKYVVSQNIDGLHLRSNLQRKYLSELHGNMFIEQCNTCNRQFVRNSAAPTVGQKSLNKACPTVKANGRPCRGRLHDTILDWEHNLPENDLGMADFNSCMSDLSICLGTTMQIVPSGNLPLYTKKHGGKLVICNLQPTKHDRKADLLIHFYVDDVMILLMKSLNLKIPKYSAKNDPTKSLSLTSDKYFEWTISDLAIQKMRKIYEAKCGTKEAKKRLNMIDDEELPSRITKSLKKSKQEESDDDLEVLDVIVKSKKSSKESSKKNLRKRTASPPDYSSTITVKKVNPPKKGKYETEKIIIKKNVTPTKTKYEIVPTKEKSKRTKCEIVYSTDDVCDDLEMICESGSEDEQSTFRCNFKRYLYDDKALKEEKKEDSADAVKVEEQDKKVEDKDKKEEASTEVKQDVSEDVVMKDESQPEECKTEVVKDEVKEVKQDAIVEEKESKSEEKLKPAEMKSSEIEAEKMQEQPKVNEIMEVEKVSDDAEPTVATTDRAVGNADSEALVKEAEGGVVKQTELDPNNKTADTDKVDEQEKPAKEDKVENVPQTSELLAEVEKQLAQDENVAEECDVNKPSAESTEDSCNQETQEKLDNVLTNPTDILESEEVEKPMAENEEPKNEAGPKEEEINNGVQEEEKTDETMVDELAKCEEKRVESSTDNQTSSEPEFTQETATTQPDINLEQPSNEERFLNENIGENFGNFYENNFTPSASNTQLDFLDSY